MPDDTIEVHERLARMEALLEAIQESLRDQKNCDANQDIKLDKILENDKDKLQRITKTEVKVKNIKATLFVFAGAISAAVARWFI